MNDNSNDSFEKLEFDKNRGRVKYCPCGKSNRDGKFSPYKGFEDKGYCFGCGETFLPKTPPKNYSQNFFKKAVPKFTAETKPASFIPLEMVKKSLKEYQNNNFVIFLISLVGVNATNVAIGKYLIGTSKFWPNATIFWQITKDRNLLKTVRTGKIIQYLIVASAKSFIGKDCKRNKDNFPQVKWVHKNLKFSEFNLKQALFGEHLLSIDFVKPVAIVESEKTAVIASIYLPQFIWIAVGSLTNLSLKNCQVLKGRSIVLFPDLNGFDLWTQKAKELSALARVSVSDLLERKALASERELGLDLADYLIRFDYKNFVNQEIINSSSGCQSEQNLVSVPEKRPIKTIPLEQRISKVIPVKRLDLPHISAPKHYSEFNFDERIWKIQGTTSWKNEVNELKVFFSSSELPNVPIKLDSGSIILNIYQFISSHIATLKNNDGNKYFEPYLIRLNILKQSLLREKIEKGLLKPP